MGWFGCGALDGDDGLDLQSLVFGEIGVKYDDNYNCLTSEAEITMLLKDNQSALYDWIRDYNWSQHHNPGWQQCIYIQALMQLFIDYEVKISERGKIGGLPFIANDKWAETNKERKEAMDVLLVAVKGS